MPPSNPSTTPLVLRESATRRFSLLLKIPVRAFFAARTKPEEFSTHAARCSFLKPSRNEFSPLEPFAARGSPDPAPTPTEGLHGSRFARPALPSLPSRL